MTDGLEPALKRAFAAAIAASFALTALVAAIYPFLEPTWRDLIWAGKENEPWLYDWQLVKATTWSRITSWGGYAAQQIAVWLLAWRASREGGHPTSLSKANLGLLCANLGFALLHVLQTWFFYDGIAQDVPTWTSQYSVIVMLVLVLYMLAPTRGLFLGIKARTPQRGRAFVGKWHGIYLAWALVYTFWFHPAVGEIGLLVGFLYMFLLMTQLSLAYTRIHYAVGWITLLEFLVGVHGPAIALQKGQSAWPMFVGGFLFMTAFTQQYSFKLKPWARALVFAAYAAIVVAMYSQRGFGRLYEILFIPTALYGGAYALVGLSLLLDRLIPRRAAAGS